MGLLARLLVCGLFSMISLACAAKGEQRSFSLEVTNKADRPITVGLSKMNGPVEVDWESPEDRALMDPKLTGLGWGVIVPPGRSASINVTGEFFSNASGYLRVYNGGLRLSEILAISKGSGNRLDILLQEGQSVFEVRAQGSYLVAQLVKYVPGGMAAQRSPSMKLDP